MHRLRIRLARHHTGQGRGGAFVADEAVDNGDSGCADRRPSGRDLFADLQAGFGGIDDLSDDLCQEVIRISHHQIDAIANSAT